MPQRFQLRWSKRPPKLPLYSEYDASSADNAERLAGEIQADLEESVKALTS